MNSLALLVAVVVTWTNPTQNTDGSALAAAQITRTRIEYGTCVGPAFGVKGGEALVTGAATTTSIDRPVGTHCFRAATTANGVESAFSNVATKTISQPPPSPPTNLVADPGNLIAYAISQTPDRMTVAPVGTVAAGTTCDGTQTVNNLYRVPRASVTYAGDVRPAVVFAPCVPG
jgi:hypothetical protein